MSFSTQCTAIIINCIDSHSFSYVGEVCNNVRKSCLPDDVMGILPFSRFNNFSVKWQTRKGQWQSESHSRWKEWPSAQTRKTRTGIWGLPFLFSVTCFSLYTTCVHWHNFVTSCLCNGNSARFNMSFPHAQFMTLPILQSHRDNIKKRNAKLRDVAKENKLSGKVSDSFLFDYSYALPVIILWPWQYF